MKHIFQWIEGFPNLVPRVLSLPSSNFLEEGRERTLGTRLGLPKGENYKIALLEK